MTSWDITLIAFVGLLVFMITQMKKFFESFGAGQETLQAQSLAPKVVMTSNAAKEKPIKHSTKKPIKAKKKTASFPLKKRTVK